MDLPSQVKIVEVGPRDGLQNEKQIIPTSVKVDFINRLSETGLRHIEATSFVSAKWIPQLADHTKVFTKINHKNTVTYSALVPNLQGLEAAIAAGVREIAVFTAASETFSQKNINCSIQESLNRFEKVIELSSKHQIKVRGYISCVLGCPYEGEILPKKVAEVAKELIQLGCYEVSLGDTIGVGTPRKAQNLVDSVRQAVSINTIAAHFHNTYGQALANIFAVLQQGVSTFDASVAGLGGCPYAEGASGNVATEDLIYLLHGLGIQTHIDLYKLCEVGAFISEQLKKAPDSKVNQVLTLKQKHKSGKNNG